MLTRHTDFHYKAVTCFHYAMIEGMSAGSMRPLLIIDALRCCRRCRYAASCHYATYFHAAALPFCHALRHTLRRCCYATPFHMLRCYAPALRYAIMILLDAASADAMLAFT